MNSYERRAVAGTLAYGLSELLLPLLQLLSSIVVVRALGRAQYGEVALVLSLFGVAGLMLDPGIGAWTIAEAARRRGGDDRAGAARLLRSFAAFQVRWGALLGLAVVAVGLALRPRGIAGGAIWAWLGAYVLASGVESAVSTTYHAHTLFARQVLLRAVQYAVRLILLIGLWRAHLLSPVWVVASYPLGTAAGLLPFIAPWRSLLREAPAGRLPIMLWIGELRRSLSSVGWSALRLIPEITPLWLLRTLAGLEAVAVYQVGFRAYALVHAMIRSVESAMFPLVSEGLRLRPRDVARLMTTAVRGLFLAALVGVPVLWWLAPRLVTTLFGARYAESAAVFQVCVLSLLLFPVIAGQRSLLFALERVHLLARAAAGSGVVYLVVLGALAPGSGAHGAAAALVAYTAASAGLTALAMRAVADPALAAAKQ